MSEDNKISFAIIISVYNTAKYLRGCLDSLINQTYKDWEAYCVDDCSTDNSLDVLNEYALKDKRIKVFSTSYNKGASKNRNIALELIQPHPGRWIYSIDSDDYISRSMLEIIATVVDSTAKRVDCVRLNFQRTTKLYPENGDAHILISPKSVDFEVVSHEKFFSEYEVGGYNCAACVNSMIVDRHHLRYPVNQLIMEDQGFTIPCFVYAENLIVIRQPFYYYYSNPSSLLKIKSYSSKCDAIRLINNLYPLLNEHSVATRNYLYRDFLPSRLHSYLSFALHSSKSSGNVREKLNPEIRFFSCLRGVKSHIKYLMLFITKRLWD